MRSLNRALLVLPADTVSAANRSTAMPTISSKPSPKAKPPVKSKSTVKATPKSASKRPAAKATAKKHSPIQVRKAETPQPTAAPSKDPSKQTQLIEMLRSDSGGTIDQMVKLTGWQPHTVRGTISGALRKRLGLLVQNAVSLDSGARVYRIVDAP